MNDDKKVRNPEQNAHKQADQDMAMDRDLTDAPDAADTRDLDEGELAQKDNSDEKAFDALENPRSTSR